MSIYLRMQEIRTTSEALDGQAGYQFVHGDIGNEALMNELMKQGVDVVVHFAAESHVDRSIHNPRSFVLTNVVGTQSLLEAARKHQGQEIYSYFNGRGLRITW